MAHNYDNPELPKLLSQALAEWEALAKTVHAIQEATNIPALHTDLRSLDRTPGVLERLSDIHDSLGDWRTRTASLLEVFMAFDDLEDAAG